MASFENPYVAEMLVQGMVIALFLGTLVCLAVGVALVSYPAPALRFIAWMNRWVSSREAIERLETPRIVDGLITAVPKRRIVAGALLIVGGSYAAIVLTSQVNVPMLLSIFRVSGTQAIVAGLLIEALRIFFVLGCTAAVMIGLTLCFLPTAWGGLETRVNLWYSTSMVIPGGDHMHMTLDRLIEAFPRTAGAIIAALSAIPALAAGMLLFSRLG